MKGNEEKLIEFIDGHDKRFVIPVYQRTYDWKIENCKQLYCDLIKIEKNNRKSHFFGSIVAAYNPDGEHKEYLIIDGQQRLTTVSLLLLAIYNLLKDKVLTSEDKNIERMIFEDFLVDKYEPTETRLKLKPVKEDQEAFGNLFGKKEDYIIKSNLTTNYNYFYTRIQKQEITIDQLFDAIKKLEVINISLNQDDNPQLIFESLNSTGLALSEGDKIRNFVLMGLSTKEQELFYDNYWKKIEVNCGFEDKENTKGVSGFVRDYLSIKLQKTPSINKIYVEFKEYVENSKIYIEEILKDLLEYSQFYEILRIGNSKNENLNNCITRLNKLETTVTRPFFLEILRLNKNGVISANDTEKIFIFTENFLFRRTMCDVPTNMLNKLFVSLHKEIVGYDKSTDNYLEKFKYNLLSKKEKARFPQNSEFLNAFITKEVYLMNRKNKLYILDRLENFGTKETKEIWEKIENGTYSIEHIMPQHLTPQWEKALGDDYKNIHETWLHRISNLTLTAYNSEYSNNTFLEKRDCKDGFKNSGLRVNQLISQKTKWTLNELEERTEDLKNKALEIWELPTSSYKPSEKVLDSYSLDDDIDLTGFKIAKFSYKNYEQPVKRWVDAFQAVLIQLHSENDSVLKQLAIDNDPLNDLAKDVSNNPEDFNASIKIADDIYVWSNNNTQTKINMLRKFFKLYDVDCNDLVFYLKSDGELN